MWSGEKGTFLVSLINQPLWKRGSFGRCFCDSSTLIYDNFAGGFIRADETLKLTDKSPHHLLIITNDRMFSHYPLLNF